MQITFECDHFTKSSCIYRILCQKFSRYPHWCNFYVNIPSVYLTVRNSPDECRKHAMKFQNKQNVPKQDEGKKSHATHTAAVVYHIHVRGWLLGQLSWSGSQELYTVHPNYKLSPVTNIPVKCDTAASQQFKDWS